eukprot:Gb_24715 [translate_table: standard]
MAASHWETDRSSTRSEYARDMVGKWIPAILVPYLLPTFTVVSFQVFFRHMLKLQMKLLSVFHYGYFGSPVSDHNYAFQKGQEVFLSVDKPRRDFNARLSADCLVELSRDFLAFLELMFVPYSSIMCKISGDLLLEDGIDWRNSSLS